MALYGAFASSMLGMMSQTHALHNIGTNLANVNTGGYKGTDTHFGTVLSQRLSNVSDIGGVRPSDKATVTQQGFVVSSSQATDVAISGQGFFVMNTAQDGTGDTVYGRDGSFEIKAVNDISITGNGGQTVTVKDGYLADKNGYFIQGWAYQNGTVTTTGTPSSLRVDQYAFLNQFEATTSANLALNLPAGDTLNNANPYDITVYDSAGATQPVQLNFTRTGTNAWNVAATNQQPAVAQVDTVTLGGTVGEVGDVYSVTVNGNGVTYTTDGTEASIDVIRDKLIAAINADAQVSQNVTATAGGTGAISLTAVTAGNAITTTSSATQGPASVAQVDTITVGGTVEVDDVYSVTVDGTTVSYTAIGGDTLTDVRNALIPLVSALPGVTAAAGGAVTELTITADTAGTPFTATASAADGGSGTLDNTAVRAATTANYTALTDNTATTVTTTANVPPTVTGAATALTFNSDGTINTPTTLNLALNFGTATATVAVDISNITQYYGEFMPNSYSKDGFGSSSMRSFNFSPNGDVVGVFEDNTSRTIYKLSLGVFANPNALEAINGNVYKSTNDSGAATITTAGDNGYASLTPNARELSNIDIADEFSKMMMTQTAYNASSTVFRTADEMVTTARDLKR